MVAQGPRTPRNLHGAMDRIARGEPGHEPRGLVPGLQDPPSFQVRQAAETATRGMYPRNESIHSLQFSSPIEARAVRGKTARDLTPSTEAESAEEMPLQQSPRCVRFAPEPAEPVVEVPAASRKSADHSPRKHVPSGPPPRSGKSMFLTKTSRPLVTKGDPSPTQPQLSPAMERICRGESGHNRDGLVPQMKSSPIPTKPVSANPTTRVDLEAAYPRNGSIHSLQYRSTAERAGAYQAPDPGRHSVSRHLPEELYAQGVCEDFEENAEVCEIVPTPDHHETDDCLDDLTSDSVLFPLELSPAETLGFTPPPRQRKSSQESQTPVKGRKPFR